jgi:methyl-accepting chemotaxis protein
MVSTMQEIHTSSSRINEIIGTIDGIAFQTDILALNAAVEAAHAGEQDRGFAVVAGEVRSLAQRSATAANEIAELMTESVGRVESGARIVQGAGDTMRRRLDNARQIHDLVGSISQASAEQSTGVAQVGSSVQQLVRMTQQNRALVEQTAAAAEALKDQAKDMAAQVAKFKLPAARG